jgi:hypothetical protein
MLLVAPRLAAQQATVAGGVEGSGSAGDAAEGSGQPAPGDAPRAGQRGTVEPWDLGLAELRAQGWQVDAEDVQPGTFGARLVAFTGGVVVHGAGHLMLGDEVSAFRMLLGEALGAGAALGGRAIATNQSTGSPLRPVGEGLAVVGTSLFVTTWLADVVGSVRGTGAPLPRNTRRLDGLEIEAWYTTRVAGSRITNIGVLSVPVHLRHATFGLEAQVDSTAEYRRLGGYAGGRLPMGHDGLTALELGAFAFDERLTSRGTGRTTVEPTLALALDLGAVWPHLTGMLWRNSAAVRVDGLRFAPDEGFSLFSGDRLIRFPVGTELSMNVNRGVNLGIGYEQRDDLLVGALDAGGVVRGRLSIVPRERVGIDVVLEQGAWVRAWLGVRWFVEAFDGVDASEAAVAR